MARTANLIFIVLDVLKPLGHKQILESELEGFGIRMNKQPPNIIFKRKDKGGINLQVGSRIRYVVSCDNQPRSGASIHHVVIVILSFDNQLDNQLAPCRRWCRSPSWTWS